MAGDTATDWSLALRETDLGDPGAFTNTTGGVVWTIAGEAAPGNGSWNGNLHNRGANIVLTGVTGEFSTTYSEGGHKISHMIGGFGAHVE